MSDNGIHHDRSAYRREADRFLARRDGTLQARQVAAIRKATDGPLGDLAAVRTARNVRASLPRDVTAEWVTPEMRLYAPARGRDLPLLVYLHGGGWVLGSVASCSAFCGAVAATGAAVLALEYPLAPERPFPSSIGAAYRAYRTVTASPARFRCDPARVSLGGDSAGGNLALAATYFLQSEDEAPRSLVLYYPVTEARADGSESWREFATGCGMDAAFMEACNAAYLQGHSAGDPLASPGFADAERLRRLPPVHLLAADRDVLRDQGRRFAENVRAAGGSIRYELLPGSTHLFVTVPGQPAAFRRAVSFAAEALEA